MQSLLPIQVCRSSCNMAYNRGVQYALPASLKSHIAFGFRGNRVVPLVNFKGLGVSEDLLAVDGMEWVEFTRLVVNPGTTVTRDGYCVSNQIHLLTGKSAPPRLFESCCYNDHCTKCYSAYLFT